MGRCAYVHLGSRLYAAGSFDSKPALFTLVSAFPVAFGVGVFVYDSVGSVPSNLRARVPHTVCCRVEYANIRTFAAVLSPLDVSERLSGRQSRPVEMKRIARGPGTGRTASGRRERDHRRQRAVGIAAVTMDRVRPRRRWTGWGERSTGGFVRRGCCRPSWRPSGRGS